MLFVTDPGLRKLGLCDAAIASLESVGASVAIFDSVEADPSLATVMKAVENGRSAGATGVAGFGGGSSLDVAKVAALLLGSGEDIDGAWGVAQAKGPRLPLVLAPTTAGTGSEVTPVSIITVGDEEKRGVSSAIILPDIAVLDPELTLGLPPAITAATGVDAMVHAIEAYASKNANNNPLSKMLARQALQLIGASIEKRCLTVRMSRRGGDVARLHARRSSLRQFAGGRRPRACLSDRGRSMSRTASRTHLSCRMSCASTRPTPPISTPRSPRTLSHVSHKRKVCRGCAAFIEELASLSKRLGLQPRLRDVGIGEEHLKRWRRMR